jgi:MFS family permease
MSGLALGITYAGPGIGVAIALPIAGQLIEASGWRSAALAFLAASLVSIVFVWLMTSGPRIVVPVPPAERTRGRDRAAETEVARHASGLHEASGPGAVASAQEPLPLGSDAAQGSRHGSVRRTLRTRRFWVLFAGAAAIGAFDEGVLQAFLPQAVRSGLGAGFAASALGLQSLAYVGGQVVGGWLSDRYGRRVVGAVSAGVIALGVVAIFLAPSGTAALVAAGIVAHGVGSGATIAVRSAAFSDVFGGANFGTIFGILAVAYPIGGTVAVYFGALAFDRLDSYLPLLAIVLVALAAWAVALWVAGPRRRPTPTYVVTPISKRAE